MPLSRIQSNILVYKANELFYFRWGLPQPIYVNIVRDPVERVISWYYYVRAPWYYVERKQAFPDLPLPDPAWLKKVLIDFQFFTYLQIHFKTLSKTMTNYLAMFLM